MKNNNGKLWKLVVSLLFLSLSGLTWFMKVDRDNFYQQLESQKKRIRRQEVNANIIMDLQVETLRKLGTSNDEILKIVKVAEIKALKDVMVEESEKND